MELSSAYKVKLVLDESGDHFYQIDGSADMLPGVTGILNVLGKPALVPWAAKITAEYWLKAATHYSQKRWPSAKLLQWFYKRSKRRHVHEKERAADNGTVFHALFDAAIQGADVQSSSVGWESFRLWRGQERLKIIAGDTKIASRVYKYGGSLDFIMEDDKGKFVVGDFKTGNGIYDTHALQVAAYAMAMTEQYGLKYVPAGVIIRLDKKKIGYERREIKNMGLAFRAFIRSKELSELMRLEFWENKQLVRERIKKETLL